MDDSTAARFWSYVDKEGPTPAHRPELGPCWVWKGTPSRKYGAFWYEGKPRLVYRFAYEQFVAPIPDGFEIDHLCKNTRCLRYEGHLDPVPRAVNNARSTSPSALNAVKTECKRGHSLTDEANVYPQGNGARGCRTCRDEYRREWSKKRAQNLPELAPRRQRCSNGHALTDETSFVTKEGYWACGVCRKEANARNRRKANPELLPPSAERTHCPQGHPYSGENTKVLVHGGRACRTCRRASGRERKRAQAEAAKAAGLTVREYLASKRSA